MASLRDREAIDAARAHVGSPAMDNVLVETESAVLAQCVAGSHACKTRPGASHTAHRLAEAAAQVR